MKCYVVIEDDRGMGISVEAVYLSKERAEDHASDSSHFYVYESEIDNFDIKNVGTLNIKF